ncbi:MAG: uroporphyrinogen-III synthase [Alphaproteobacteria bacterium]|nr:uroporphyrinogen-III synthase [Alphaproteobacteria bacterium]
MAILVTRAHPENEATAAALRGRGHDVWLAPVLKFEPRPFAHDPEGPHSAVIVTSANAIRAVTPRLAELDLARLPLFAVGETTAKAAREAGFANVIVAAGDALSLPETILARADRLPKDTHSLLYLAGVDFARDLAPELRAAGFSLTTLTTYRMIPVGHLPHRVCAGFASHAIEAVLHYSRRSAWAFLEAARAEGVEISALAIPQCCLSQNVAGVLREAGATQVGVAAAPDEMSLFTTLERALAARPA